MAGDFPITDGTTTVHGVDLNNMLKIYALAGALVGTPPSAGASSAWKVQFASSLVTTNAAGGFAINFPSAFPGGLGIVVAMVGDNTPGSDMTCVGVATSYTASGWQGVLTSAGAVVNTQACRVNYIAIGW